MGDSTVFAVAGAKGGVGKTTSSINLSAALAAMGHDVLLVELDLAMANVSDFLAVDARLEHDREPTLHDVLAGEATPAEATYGAPGGFDVLPSGTTLSGFLGATIDKAASVVASVREEYDVVLLDTASGLGTETILPLAIADETILVSSPRVAAVRDTKKTRDLVHHVDGGVTGILFVGSSTGRTPGIERIADFLSVDLVGHIPEDTAVTDAQDTGRPVLVANPESDAAKAYRTVALQVNEHVSATLPEDPLAAARDSGFEFGSTPAEAQGHVGDGD